MKKLLVLLSACLIAALSLAGCAREAPRLALDPAYADAKVGNSHVVVRNGQVESYSVCAELGDQLVALKYQQGTLSVENDVECTPCEVTCAEFETFANLAIETFGDIYGGKPYGLSVFDLMWDQIDPEKDLNQDFYVYDLNAEALIYATDWDKGYDGYSGYAYLSGDRSEPSDTITFFFCR